MRLIFCVLYLLFTTLGCSSAVYKIPIDNQSDWDRLKESISEAYVEGYKDIEVNVKARQLMYGRSYDLLNGIKDQNLRIRFNGNGVVMIPYGEKCKAGDEIQSYSLDDVFLDEQFRIVDNKEVARTVDGEIQPIPELGHFYVYKSDNSLVESKDDYDPNTMNERFNVYRFKVEMPDIPKEDCRNFYMLLSRQWAYYRHKVLEVKDGYLYFNFFSEDAPSNVQKYGLDPNSDLTGYGIYPRYRLINYPLSDVFTLKGDKIAYDDALVYHSKGECMIRISRCRIARLSIEGFDIRGCSGNHAIGISDCQFTERAEICKNKIAWTSHNSIYISKSKNVCIQHNQISDTRRGAIKITNSSSDCIVDNNILKKIGWMGQTFAISASGDNITVSNNQIQDFLYSAISSGRNSNVRIVNNEISYSKEYAENYNLNTICDGGAIYIGPGAKHCVIADNLIYNICGNGANRGIFCDDGCCNMDIHGNFIIMNHHGKKGEYDIDLRYCETYKSTIPNHNTSNKIYGNYLTGYYRFQGIGNDDGCYDGKDYLFDTGLKGKNILNVSNEDTDEVYEGCEIINGDLFVPQSLRNRLRRLPISKGFRKKIKFKKI